MIMIPPSSESVTLLKQGSEKGFVRTLWVGQFVFSDDSVVGSPSFCSGVASDEFVCSVDGVNVCSINVHRAAFIFAIISLLLNHRGRGASLASTSEPVWTG
jgi:hypothetical protein